MKLKFGCIITDGRGALGGSVVAKCRSGHYMRTKVTPINTRSASQYNVRNKISRFASTWRALSEQQRKLWNTAVPLFMSTDVFGDKHKPSGFHLFVKLNTNLALVGRNPITFPPRNTSVSTSPVLSISVGSSPQTIIMILSSLIPSSSFFVVRCSPCVSSGRKYFSSELRKLIVFNPSTGTIFHLTTFYQSKFGLIKSKGSRIKFEYFFVDAFSGLPSARLSMVVSVVT